MNVNAGRRMTPERDLILPIRAKGEEPEGAVNMRSVCCAGGRFFKWLEKEPFDKCAGDRSIVDEYTIKEHSWEYCIIP